MKTLIYNNDESVKYSAEKIVKNENSIIGYNGANEVFSFKGVSDFSLFKLKNGSTYDVEVNTEEMLLEEIANLKVEIMKLKGGVK